MKKVALLLLIILLGSVVRQYLQPKRPANDKIATVSSTDTLADDASQQPMPTLAELDIEQAAQLRIPNQIIATVEASWLPSEPTPTEAVYSIIPASTVKWTGRRVGGEQRGTLAINEGWINLQGGQVTQGVLVFDMTTIKTTDQDAQGLTDELKSYNFFDVTTYPTAVFTITRVIGSRITGVLTMKGISNTITFPWTIIVENDNVVVDAEFAFDRKMRNVLWGGPVTSDFIELNFTIRFTKE